MSNSVSQTPNSKWYPQPSPTWNSAAGRSGVNQAQNWNPSLSVNSNPAYSGAGQVPDAMNRRTYSASSAITTPHGGYSWSGAYPTPLPGVNQGMPPNYDKMPRGVPGGPMRCPPQQQRLCDDTGCTGAPPAPLDPYICTSIDAGNPSCCESMEVCCDWTFGFMLIFFLLTAVGVGLIFGTSENDNLFHKFNAIDGNDLNTKMTPYIKWKNLIGDQTLVNDEPCTRRRLLGSNGSICMEDNLNANVLVTQLSQWNNARNSLWCLALIYTFIAVVYALFIHCQRQAVAPTGLEVLEGLPPLSPEKHAELLQMTLPQQQNFIREYQRFITESSNIPPVPQGNFHQDRRSDCCYSSKIEVYDTLFYEFMRIAWLFIGFTVLAWTVNLLISLWSFLPFYTDETTGPLHDFWVRYQRRFTSTLIVIVVYLAWPFFNFFVEFVFFIIFLIPWLMIRAVCFPQIGNYRPSLPLSKLPGWIRIDMFFMDMQDVRRLGFSRQAWILLTGSEQPFCGHEDPEVDRDPNLTNLRRWRDQWRASMYGAPLPWGGPVPMSVSQTSDPPGLAHPGVPPPGSIQDAHTANSSLPNVYGPHFLAAPVVGEGGEGGGAARPGETPPPPPLSLEAPTSPAPSAAAEEEGGGGRHRRRHRRHRSRSPEEGGRGEGERGAGAPPSSSRRHRHHSHNRKREATVTVVKSTEGRGASAPSAETGAGGGPPRFPDVLQFKPGPRLDEEGRRTSRSPTPEAAAATWQPVNLNRDHNGRNEGKNPQEMELDELMKL